MIFQILCRKRQTDIAASARAFECDAVHPETPRLSITPIPSFRKHP
jgi:hypothetical protein